MPSSTLVYTIGIAIRNEMIIDSRREGTQIKTRITKLATGAAFTAPTSGAASVWTARQRPAAAASATPTTTASIKPTAIRASESPTAPQNSPACASSTRRAATSAGPTRMIRELMACAASCQTTSQNATASARSPQTGSGRGAGFLPVGWLRVARSLKAGARRCSRSRRRGACRPRPGRSDPRAPRGSRRAGPSCRRQRRR